MTPLKECFKCNTVKPLNEFYKDKTQRDGHQYKCKECANEDIKKYKLKNIEKVRESNRKYQATEKARKATRERVNAWNAQDKRKPSCHTKVRRAIIKGILIKENCARCGNDNTHAHHEDYDKPLDVIWLCQPCHRKRHLEIKKEKANETPPSL